MQLKAANRSPCCHQAGKSQNNELHRITFPREKNILWTTISQCIRPIKVDFISMCEAQLKGETKESVIILVSWPSCPLKLPLLFCQFVLTNYLQYHKKILQRSIFCKSYPSE